MKSLATKILHLKSDFEKVGQANLYINIVAALSAQNKEAAEILNVLTKSVSVQANKVVSSTARFVNTNPNPRKEDTQQGCDGCGSNSTVAPPKKVTTTTTIKVIKSNIQPTETGEEKLIDVTDPELDLVPKEEGEETLIVGDVAKGQGEAHTIEKPKNIIEIKISAKEIKDRYKTLDEMKQAAETLGITYPQGVTYLKMAVIIADAINLA